MNKKMFVEYIKYAYKFEKINENRQNMHFFYKIIEVCKIWIFNFQFLNSTHCIALISSLVCYNSTAYTEQYATPITSEQ